MCYCKVVGSIVKDPFHQPHLGLLRFLLMHANPCSRTLFSVTMTIHVSANLAFLMYWAWLKVFIAFPTHPINFIPPYNTSSHNLYPQNPLNPLPVSFQEILQHYRNLITTSCSTPVATCCDPIMTCNDSLAQFRSSLSPQLGIHDQKFHLDQSFHSFSFLQDQITLVLSFLNLEIRTLFTLQV